MVKTKSSARGAEALFLAAFTYAFTGILVREVSPMWGDKAQVAARFSLVLILLLAFNLFRKNKLRVPRKNLPVALGLGIYFSLTVLFFTAAIQKTTVANTLFVFYAATMVVSFILGTTILKENVTRSKAVAIVFAMAGLALYSGAIIGGSLGIIFSILAGVACGLGNLAAKQLANVNRTAVLTVQYMIAVAFTVPLTLISGEKIIRTASLHVSLLTVLFALVIILGSYLVLYGFQHIDVNIGMVIESSELIFAAIMAYFLFNEVPKTHELLGGILVFTGAVIGSGILEKKSKTEKIIAQPD